jgi:transposase
MWATSPVLKVYLGLGETDMRKSIDGLCILVSTQLKQNPLSGHMFIFCNRRRTILKILYWDRNGFCLWHKRLEKDKFRWPKNAVEVKEITSRQLQWLIEGLDINQAEAHASLNYETVY